MNIGFDPTKFQECVVVDQFTRTPNNILDDYMAEMPPLAFKCYMLILRQTTGFNRSSAKITTSVFRKTCGIKTDESVSKSIKYLEQIGLVSVYRETGEMNVFHIKKPQEQVKTIPPQINHTTPKKQGGTTPVKQGGTTPKKQGSNKENFKETIKENIYSEVDQKFTSEINEIFEFWKTTFNKPKTKLGDKRKGKIKARLNQGYSVDDIKLAIVNCSKSEFHVKGGHIDLELICRDETKIDKFMIGFQNQQAPGNTQNKNSSWRDYFSVSPEPQMRDVQPVIGEWTEL